jgi:hypothetical protein
MGAGSQTSRSLRGVDPRTDKAWIEEKGLRRAFPNFTTAEEREEIGNEGMREFILIPNSTVQWQ